jgi:hypothetical protein
VTHIVGDLLTRATTLLYSSSQLTFYTRIYGPPKSRESEFQEFWDSQLRSLETNDIWVLAPWPGTDNAIRGKVVASLSSGCGESCESVFACGSSVHQKCSNCAVTNLLFGLCRSMWIIDLLVIHPSPHLGAPTHPSTPEVLRARECTPTPYPFVVFTFGLVVESIKEFGGASSIPRYNSIVMTSFVKGNNCNKTRLLVSHIKFN